MTRKSQLHTVFSLVWSPNTNKQQTHTHHYHWRRHKPSPLHRGNSRRWDVINYRTVSSSDAYTAARGEFSRRPACGLTLCGSFDKSKCTNVMPYPDLLGHELVQYIKSLTPLFPAVTPTSERVTNTRCFRRRESERYCRYRDTIWYQIRLNRSAG